MSYKLFIVLVVISFVGLVVSQRIQRPRDSIPQKLPVTYGCHRRRCWTRCHRFGRTDEWCWAGLNRRSVTSRCAQDIDCKPSLACTSVCTPYPK